MSNVIDFPDKDSLKYIEENDEIIGVCDGAEIVNLDESTVLISAHDLCMEKTALKELMIAWLALNYPDVLNFDE